MGMFVECQKELIKVLKASGCEKQPFTSKKKMETSAESRISAVLCEEETLERHKGGKVFTDAGGKKHKRTRVYNRDIAYTVVIGEYSNDRLEEIYEKFLAGFPDGIYVDGNYVAFGLSETEWMAEKDHILHAKVAVQVKVICRGGLYKDTDMVRLKDIGVEVGKEE